MVSDDRRVLRDLAMAYMAVCRDGAQEERRTLWRAHNSLKPTRPPIYTRAFAWNEMEAARCVCADPFYRGFEDRLRRRLFWAALDDDSVFEPWISVDAAWVSPPEGIWGLPINWIGEHVPGVARAMDPPIVEPEDARRMVAPHHAIDEEETARRAAKLEDAIGDIITVDVDRAPLYRSWNGDISTQIAQLRGMEQLMTDMMERPEWLHGVLAFMRDGVLRTHEEAERAGDWGLSAHENQAMPYAEELPDPAPNTPGAARRQLWYFCASQETTLIGPAMFDEFMLQYQIPIMAPFGLVSYGCCEDLTLKIDVIRRIPNLRRIAVSPMADAARCAEQIGRDYILSYRPSPSDMVGYDFDPERIRRILRRDLAACRGCHVDITLKDVETVQGDPDRVRNWVRITREVIDELW
ncbi:MAG: hypothetical protein JXR94_22760 [Candidatus Hydrogenedentes bacterium]|nr:hypothetical protein [Candidatus Hydrogenedentota bacterium]